MMNDMILNTPKEATYRLLLALSTWPEKEFTSRWISAMDFVAEYGAVFGISAINLHGNNGMKFTEYVVRLDTVDLALRNMVLNGWATVSVGNLGYSYRIAYDGKQLAKSFQTSYARLYCEAADAAYKKYGELTEQELDTMINRRSVESASREKGND